MTATTPSTATTGGMPRRELGQPIVKVITSTDHKVIGNLYLVHVVRLVPGRAASWRCSCAPSWPTPACSS